MKDTDIDRLVMLEEAKRDGMAEGILYGVLIGSTFWSVLFILWSLYA